jgi:hypothetical protein
MIQKELNTIAYFEDHFQLVVFAASSLPVEP